MLNLSLPTTVILIGAISVLIVVVLLALVFIKARKVNLTQATNEKPDWMRNTPPKETMAATLADGEGIQVFDEDEGEVFASAFAEQIEDILQAKLASDPALQKYKLDLGSAPDGSLEIWINGEKYADVNAIPDEKLKTAFNEAIAAWKKG